MSEIVARLRDRASYAEGENQFELEDDLREAADEIEQLRAKLEYAVTGYKEAANEIERLTAALEIIAGRRQCLDNLMSNAEVARAAFTHRPRDDGTVVAVGGEPGASAGKSE